MELQGTLLDSIMDIDLAQGIKTMIANVLSAKKVPGGTVLATVQTSMVSTMVDHIHPMLSV